MSQDRPPLGRSIRLKEHCQQWLFPYSRPFQIGPMIHPAAEGVNLYKEGVFAEVGSAKHWRIDWMYTGSER